MKFLFLLITTCFLLFACALPPNTVSNLHASEQPKATALLVPPSLRPVRLPALPPAPTPRAAQEVFSVVVNGVPVKTLLFALARDNKLNIDIHPRVSGRVTLNATDQTLPQLLERITAQTDTRYEIRGNLLRVEPDTPYLQNYTIDYVSLLRQTTSNLSTNGSLRTTAGSGGNSTSTIRSTTENKFWDTLVSNVCQIVLTTNRNKSQRNEEAERIRLQERDDRLKIALELRSGFSNTQRRELSQTTSRLQQGAPAASETRTATVEGNLSQNDISDLLKTIIGDAPKTNVNDEQDDNATCDNASGAANAKSPLTINKESGIISANTTSKGHFRVRAFLDQVAASARRQVLIEATIVEVQLTATSQAGINWSQIVSTGAAKGLTVNLASASAALSSANAATIGYSNATSSLGSITAAISLLESFGKTKVLSSPKLSVINNQTAVIKVIDDYVYITISYSAPQINATSGTILSPGVYTSNINTVPIGFVMTVTPQISDSGEVTLNVHPSITRVISTVVDPSPSLANATPPITNLIPVVQTRELESILRVQSGEIAVLGGLMQESNGNSEQGLPGLARISGAGALTGQQGETRTKTELVVFMRPVVIKDASINGDYKEYKSQLPTSTFFDGTAAEAWGSKK